MLTSVELGSTAPRQPSPFQCAGAALVSAIAMAILLLVAPGSGLVAVHSSRPTLRLPRPTGPLFTETTDAGVNSVRNPYV
ncbi:hypothetical protein GCM10009670_23110 [Citricoccus alkalitolerans]